MIYHNDPRILIANTSLNQIMLYRWVGMRWHTQVLIKASLSKLFAAGTLVCQTTGCLAAAELGRTGSTAQTATLRQGSGSTEWTMVWKNTVPGNASGETLQLSAVGRDVWLLSTGSPAVGLMPKLLWVSQNNGQTGLLVASSDLPATKAPFAIP
jgi:hypothetical protein